MLRVTIRNNDIDMIPACYPRVMAVGAFNSMGVPTDYMDKGTVVDLLAPGVPQRGRGYKGRFEHCAR